MKEKMFPAFAMLAAFIVVLSIPALGQGMMDAGNQKSGNESDSPMMAGGSGHGPLEKGFRYRYMTSGPSASIEDEEGNKGIQLSLGLLEHDGDEGNCTIDPEELQWQVSENDDEGGKTITYRSDAQWKDQNGKIKEGSGIMMRFKYAWEGEERSLDMDIDIEKTPGDGRLSVGIGIKSSGIDKDCCVNEEVQEMKGHRFQYRTTSGETLGEMMIDDLATVDLSGDQDTVDTMVNVTGDEETQTLTISSEISEDMSSYSISGSLLVFDELLEVISDAGEKAVSYVIDHIVSFTIGLALLIIVIAAAVIFLSRKERETGGEDLKLENNRYYRKY